MVTGFIQEKKQVQLVMQHARLRRQRSVKRLTSRGPVLAGRDRACCPHRGDIAAAGATTIGANAGTGGGDGLAWAT